MLNRWKNTINLNQFLLFCLSSTVQYLFLCRAYFIKKIENPGVSRGPSVQYDYINTVHLFLRRTSRPAASLRCHNRGIAIEYSSFAYIVHLANYVRTTSCVSFSSPPAAAAAAAARVMRDPMMQQEHSDRRIVREFCYGGGRIVCAHSVMSVGWQVDKPTGFSY